MRLIDRWFPCAEVSAASYQPHGSGKMEKSLFTWFAARPIAQARAAALTSLLPWPESLDEQRQVKDLVRDAVAGKLGAIKRASEAVRCEYPNGVRTLDFFSGRGIIPLEAARAGADSWAIEYSPVATLASILLADYPQRDWSDEPPHLFSPAEDVIPGPGRLFDAGTAEERLPADLLRVLNEIAVRHERSMDAFYPQNTQGERPWGYLWAVTMPCDECKHRFPLVGTTLLREADIGAGDHGASFGFIADRASGSLEVVLQEAHHGGAPTFAAAPGKRGKLARCPFCSHPHTLDVVKARGGAGVLRDLLLLVADLAPGGPQYRLPTQAEQAAIDEASRALAAEPAFRPGVPAVPNEPIPPGNNDTVRGSLYGVRRYGDLCCARQTLSFVRLCRIINEMSADLRAAGCSEEYTRALTGYAGAVLVRKLRYSTRGAALKTSVNAVEHIFVNQASLGYGFDFFETGIGRGPATYRSLLASSTSVVRRLVEARTGTPAHIRNGSALHLPFRPGTVDAVLIDPPYYGMIDYSDASDLFFVWLKRALGGVFPELFDLDGLQPKEEEIIVRRHILTQDHRTAEHYTRLLALAFGEARRVLRPDGTLTLVFGHGDPDAWQLLLTALMDAGFVVTGSWPARTEQASGAGSANIVVTITIACRVAGATRPDGLQVSVDLEVEREIRLRVCEWERDDMSLTDQLMASYGPTMEVLGRHKRVLRPSGDLVPLDHYLGLARRVVQDAAAIKVEGLPLETFDSRTRFALFWTQLYGRQLAPRSEARFQAMASDLRLDAVRRNILEEGSKGYRLAEFGDQPLHVPDQTAVIDVVGRLVRGWRTGGTEGAAGVLRHSGRDRDDLRIWAAISFLPRWLPPADRDRKALEDINRNRRAIVGASTAPGEGEQFAFDFEPTANTN